MDRAAGVSHELMMMPDAANYYTCQIGSREASGDHVRGSREQVPDAEQISISSSYVFYRPYSIFLPNNT